MNSQPHSFTLRPACTDKDRRAAHDIRIAVLPSQRGRGVGSSLVRRLEEEGRQNEKGARR